MDRLQTMRAFARVVTEGSFAAAARAMDVDQAVVTRQVADLERHLGVKLLERTTRSMRLTEAGEVFLSRCRAILSDLEEAEAQVSQAHQAMSGRVRMAIPTLFSKETVARQLAGLLADYPDLTVEVLMLDRPVDPVSEGIDVVIADASFGVSASAVARPLMGGPFLLYASPSYLARHGEPATVADLGRHLCVTQTNGEGGDGHEAWTLEHRDGRRESVHVPVALRSNTFALGIEAVRQGVGIGRFTPRSLADDLATKELVPVLPDWRAGHLSFNLIYPGRRLIPRRVRHVIDRVVATGRQFNQDSDWPA